MVKEICIWIEKMFEIVKSGSLARADTHIAGADISMYSVGKVIRIDIKPK